MIWLRHLATAATVLIAVGLMTWLLWPQSLPETITASAEADYRVRDDHVQLNQGWLLITDGAPEVRVDDGRVNDVSGRAVVGTGIPRGEALIALADQLGLSAEEREMLKRNKRWLTAGGLALCLFSGQAIFNGETVRSEDLPRPEISEQKIEIPEPDDIEGVKELFEHVESIELRAMRDDWHFGGWLLVEGEDAKSLAGEFSASVSRQPEGVAGWDFLNEFHMTLKDGRVIQASVYEYGNLVDIRAPGWERYTEYTCKANLRKVIKVWTDKAKQIDRYPVRDLPAMRRSMSRAEKITFTDMFDENATRRGEITDAAKIERLAGLVWDDDMGFSKSHIADRDMFELTFHMPNGEEVKVNMMNTGIMSVYNGESLLRSNEIAPSENVDAIHELLQGTPAEGEGFRVKRKWTGSDSSIREPGVRIVMDEDAWVTLWAEHMAPELMETPQVDFEREMVVAVFGGDSVNSRGFHVTEILRASTGWIIRVDETTYQSAGGADDVTPFGIWVFPRSDWSVVVEENVQSLKNERPHWKQIGFRIGLAREPENILDQWYPASTHTGKLGEDHGLEKGVRIVTDGEELDEVTAAIGLDFEAPIDLEKNVVVFAVASAVEGTGNYFFELRGMNASRLVARVIAPTAQSGPNPRWVDIYGLWVLPRPEGELVIETPKYAGINESPTWQETAIRKMD